MNLDATDINILQVLMENGRLSFRQIAEKVKVSVPTVSNKVGNMENLGIIKGYSAKLDAEKLGGQSVFLTIKTRPSDVKKVAERFKGITNVRQLFIVSNGRLHLMCTFSNQLAVNEFITNLSEVSEIIEYDISNIVSVEKEEARAVVTEGASLVLQCSYCRKEIHDSPYKVRAGDKEYYLCCPVCQKGFEEKYESMKEAAEKVKA
ncbi:MAG: winged helix-turn-helix transcriptional regulator [Methanomassiliicoccales archaeon]|jgi:DNA-binding Lrp family transcriptional regulator/YHS domain-containing protein